MEFSGWVMWGATVGWIKSKNYQVWDLDLELDKKKEKLIRIKALNINFVCILFFSVSYVH